MPFCGFRKSFATALLRCFWPEDSSDEQYEKAEAAYKAYLSSNSQKELKTALINYKSAHSARTKDGHPDLADTEVNYATALWSDYEQSGRPSDKLSRIIGLDEHALTLWNGTSPKPDGYPVLLLNLGTAYFDLYLATHDGDTRALELFDELKLYSHHSNVSKDTRRKMLMMLGTALSTRCDLTKTTDRLDEAIDHLEEASGLSKPSKSSAAEGKDGGKDTDIAAIRAKCLHKLATAYDVRYRLSKGPQDLDNAIRYNNLARDALPSNHPDRAMCLYDLARQLFKRYEHAQKEKAGPVLLNTHLDVSRGMQDLKQAERVAGEAQKLLADAPNSQLKQLVDQLLDVAKQHSATVSEIASREQSRAPSPNPNEQ